MPVMEFRQKVFYNYVLEYKDYFQDPKTNPEFARFLLTKTQRDKFVRSRWVAEREVNYDGGCTWKQWVDMSILTPIPAYKYKMNVGIISQDNQSFTALCCEEGLDSCSGIGLDKL